MKQDAPFGGLLRTLRLRSGFTQAELAARAGISLKAISALERGERRHPYPYTVRALARALRLSESDRLALLHSASRGSVAASDPRPSPFTSLAQLPADVGDFTGRGDEVARTMAVYTSSAGAARSVAPFCAISGKAGVGKSALAMHIAHRLKGLYPDGQLYADLGGGARGAPPGASHAVVTRFLRALGVDLASHATADEQEALYRSTLSGRRVLVVLDDVQDDNQVRALLPGAASCGMLVTSRRRLATLAADLFVELDDLEVDDGVDLLGRVAARERTGGDGDSAAAIVRYCGGLPLAIRVVGATLKSKRHWSMARVAADLADERRRLDELQRGDLDVRGSFAWSYRALTADQARTFRLLGLLPGPEFDVGVVAAMIETDTPAAERLLEDLFEDQLLTALPGGRYRIHDLVRLFARELCLLQESNPARDAAWSRALERYRSEAELHAGALRQTALSETAIMADSLPDAVHAALAWFDREWQVLVAAIQQAHDEDRFEAALGLSSALVEFFAIQVHWSEEEITLHVALRSARSLHDLRHEAEVLNRLGAVYCNQGRWQEAAELCQQALAVFQRLGDRGGEGRALHRLGIVRCRQDRWADAFAAVEQALTAFRQVGDARSEGRAFNSLGVARHQRGDREAAITCYNRCLEISGRLADRHTEGVALLNLGFCRRDGGGWDAAIHDLARAARIFEQLRDLDCKSWTLMGLGGTYHERQQWIDAVSHNEEAAHGLALVGDRLGRAWALTGLGRGYLEQGRLEEAADCQRDAFVLFHDLGSPTGMSAAINHAGELLRRAGRSRAAADVHMLSLAICIRMEDVRGQAETMAHLGRAHGAHGSWEQARSWYERGMAARRRMADTLGQCLFHFAVGEVDRLQARWSAAATSYRASYTIAVRSGHRQEAAQALRGLADVEYDQGRLDRATALYRRALAAYRNLGYRSGGEVSVLHRFGEVHMRQGEPTRAAARYEQALAIAGPLGDVVNQHRTLAALVAAYTATGARDEALRCDERSSEIVRRPTAELPDDRADALLEVIYDWHRGGMDGPTVG